MRRLLLAVFTGCLAWASGGNIPIVRNGKPLAAVTLRDGAAPELAEAARLLVASIEKSTGARLPRNAAPGLVVIHLGEDAFTRARRLDFTRVPAEGFVIAFPDRRNIVIAGSTDRGTEYGIYEFLERYAGVRWLLPGPWGEDIPRASSITVPMAEVRQAPVYQWRRLSGDISTPWSRRSRSNFELVPNYHNLNILLPPSKYAATHPEYYPILDGKRYIPANDAADNWQPCFSAEGLAEEAARNIQEYFRTHPGTKYYSLGMNDTNRFCECDRCKRRDDPAPNFLGFRNASNTYFEWANQVAERVTRTYPGTWFGALAYGPLSQPPGAGKRIHPHIVIYMTDDRMRWTDPAVQADAHRITESWNAATSSLGWYDWIWGYPYMLPKVWFHHMGRVLDYGSRNGVRGFYAETNFYVGFSDAEDQVSPFRWGEGPKYYLLYKLLWDPTRNVDHLLDEWYERAVGPAAAPDLKAYFAHWERFWTERIFQSALWQPKGYHLNFRTYDYFDIVTPDDLAQSRRWLESAVAKASTEAQKQRARQILTTYEYYEAAALTFMDVIRAGKHLPANQQQGLERAASLDRYLANKRGREARLEQLIFHDPVLNPPIWVNEGDRWGCYPLWTLYDTARNADGPVRARVASFASAADPALARTAGLMQSLLDGKAQPLTRNADFARSADGWEVTRKGPTEFAWSAEEGHNGAGAFSGTGNFAISQEVPVSAGGAYTALGFVKVTGSPVKGSYLDVVITGADGRPIDEHYRRKTIFLEPGVWTPIATTVDFPSLRQTWPATWKEPVKMKFVLNIGQLDPGGKAYLDDCAIYSHTAAR